MFSIRLPVAAFAAVLCSVLANPAAAVPLELVFMLDYSGSNDARRADLSGRMQSFFDALLADTAIDSVRMAVMGSEFNQATLVQDMTDDINLLETAVTADLANFGGPNDEDYFETMLAALPGQPNFLGIDYSANAVKSFIVLADEPEQSPGGVGAYIPTFQASDFLVNLIVPYNPNPDPNDVFANEWRCTGSRGTVSGDGRLALIANPADAIFSICDFDDDPVAFFEQFADAKIAEVRDETGFVDVPMPASAPLMAIGLAALGLVAVRRKTL